MSTEKELQEVMCLVDCYGNAVEDSARWVNGGPASENDAYKSIETRLRAILAELEAAREDAARWQEVAFGKSLDLGVFYVDNFGDEFVLEGQEAVDVVDAARKGEA